MPNSTGYLEFAEDMDESTAPTNYTVFPITIDGSPHTPAYPTGFFWVDSKNILFSMGGAIGTHLWTVEQTGMVPKFRALDGAPVKTWGPLSYDSAAKSPPLWMIDLHNSRK